MLQILNEYVDNGMRVIEYTKDGKSISHVVKTPVPVEIEPPAPQPTLDDKVNFLYYKAMGVIS